MSRWLRKILGGIKKQTGTLGSEVPLSKQQIQASLPQMGQGVRLWSLLETFPSDNYSLYVEMSATQLTKGDCSGEKLSQGE